MYDRWGSCCTSDPDILDICHKFYSSLYSQEHQVHTSRFDFLPPADSWYLLSTKDSQALEGEITLEQLFEALKGMKKGKALGWMACLSTSIKLFGKK